ncbi:MAG: hypothetical protein IJ331_03320 [Ruminococcus sp.]|nr:hypothetical protein [Ruminococcus sp.]
MNTLRISKGKDVELFVDDELLCFVTDFSAKEICDSYPISEFLSDTYVDELPLKTRYELNITSLSHLDAKVFDKDAFDLSVVLSDIKYVYKNCHLINKQEDINPNKPVSDRYTIVSTELEVLEVAYD